jgi:osmoprotectant transport system ATP-binding protein
MSGVEIEFRGVFYEQAAEAPRVSNLSLRVESGETLVLLGRSGSGKTTTLKLVNAMLFPSRGEVRVGDKSTLDWHPVELRRRIGYVIQEAGLFPHFTIARNVGLVPALLGWPPTNIQARVHEMLELVGLEPSRFASRYPRELSGGERQRVGVARALAGDPPLVLMDEPFGALDPPTREEVRAEFCALRDRLKKTLLFVTHDLREGLFLGGRIALLRSGCLEFLGGAAELRSAAGDEARAFMRTLETAPPQGA